ncbi:MAG: tetratricopeptide repeat protein [Muribaculaceae bacterium]|nr:tetratricopeptide repeat protein [Muribaculaceae bacterium]
MKRFLTISRLFLGAALGGALLSPGAASAQVNAEQVMIIGRNVLSMDDYMLAIQYFNAAIKAKPYMADPYFYRALAKLQLDDYRGAAEDCTLALERNKFKVEAYKLRGFAQQNMGLDSLALADYEEGLRHDPTDRYFLFYKAVAESDMHRFGDARATYSSLLRQYPDFAEGYAARASMRALEGDTLAAFHDIDRSIQLNRTNINPWLLRARLRAGRHEWREALEDMEEAIRMRPDEASFYINRAYLRYNTDDFYGAMEDYNHSLELEPENEAALFNRALLRLEVRDLIHAEEDLTAVLSRDPDNFHALYNRGIARMEQGKHREALGDFNRIAAKYPKFYPVYYAIAECERERGNMKRAVANVNHADELVRRYVDDPSRNPLDRPTIQPGMPNERPDRAQDPAEEGEDMELMEKFNRLVTLEESPHAEMAYNDRIKGRVQDRNVTARPAEIFALSFMAPERMLRPRSDRFRELDEYNAGRHPAGMTLYMVEGPGAVSDSVGFELANRLIESLTPGADRPDVPAADLLTRATARAMIRNYPAALADLDRALERNPRYALALLERGTVRMLHATAEMAGKFDAASPEEENLRRRAASVMLSQAADDFAAAAAVNPRMAYAWYGKGCALYAAGDTQEAAEAFSRAIALDADMGQAWFNRGLCHLATGRRAEAFADLSKAGEAGILPAYNLLKRLR